MEGNLEVMDIFMTLVVVIFSHVCIYLQTHQVVYIKYLQLSVCQAWRRQWHPTPVLLPGKSHGWRSLVGCSPWGHEESDTTGLGDFNFTFHFPALEKDMATHSSVLAWRIPGTGEPGGLPSMGLHRVRHDWSNLAAAAAAAVCQAYLNKAL